MARTWLDLGLGSGLGLWLDLAEIKEEDRRGKGEG